jgi:hypothetical protein
MMASLARNLLSHRCTQCREKPAQGEKEHMLFLTTRTRQKSLLFSLGVPRLAADPEYEGE